MPIFWLIDMSQFQRKLGLTHPLDYFGASMQLKYPLAVIIGSFMTLPAAAADYSYTALDAPGGFS